VAAIIAREIVFTGADISWWRRFNSHIVFWIVLPKRRWSVDYAGLPPQNQGGLFSGSFFPGTLPPGGSRFRNQAASESALSAICGPSNNTSLVAIVFRCDPDRIDRRIDHLLRMIFFDILLDWDFGSGFLAIIPLIIVGDAFRRA